MKYVKQLLLILFFSLVGEALQKCIPLPIPAAIYGLVLMFLALSTGLLKPDAVAETAQFFIDIMPVLFVSPAVNVLSYWGIIAPNLVPIFTIVLASTIVVFAVSGLVTKFFLRKGGAHCG